MITLKTKTAKVTVIDKGIVKTQIEQNTILKEDDAIENYIAGFRLSLGNKHCVLIDETHNVKESSGAVEFNSCKKVAETRIASAVLVDSIYKKLSCQIKNTLNRPETPTKFFVNESSAIEWLKACYQNHKAHLTQESVSDN